MFLRQLRLWFHYLRHPEVHLEYRVKPDWQDRAFTHLLEAFAAFQLLPSHLDLDAQVAAYTYPHCYFTCGTLRGVRDGQDCLLLSVIGHHDSRHRLAQIIAALDAVPFYTEKVDHAYDDYPWKQLRQATQSK